MRTFSIVTLLVCSLIFSGCKKKKKNNGSDPVDTLPTVSTNVISSITESVAIGGGVVTSEGSSAVTAIGLCWNNSPDPTLSDDFSNNGSGAVSFTSSINGLAPGMTLYVRAYATNGVGTAYGNEVSFTTSSPWVKTHPNNVNYDYFCFLQSGSNLLAGRIGGFGTYKSSDYGMTWSATYTNNGLVRNFVEAGSKVLALNETMGVMASSDNGSTWVDSYTGLPNAVLTAAVPLGNKIIGSAPYEAAYSSTNSGQTWSLCCSSFSNSIVYKMYTYNGAIYAGANNGLYRSTDDGMTWACVAFSTIPVRDFATIGSTLFTAAGTKIYRSPDGLSWTSITDAMSGISFENVETFGNSVYISSSTAGVYVSTDGGVTWSLQNSGLTQTDVKVIYITGNKMYANTISGSLFRKTL